MTLDLFYGSLLATNFTCSIINKFVSFRIYIVFAINVTCEIINSLVVNFSFYEGIYATNLTGKISNGLVIWLRLFAVTN